jgi:drug/metabolite transporter (DMT)-like permease
VTDLQRGVTATVLAALVWSTGGLFIKLLPQDAFTILFYRSVYAMLVFGLVYRRTVLATNARMWWTSFIYAGLLLTFVVATKLTTAANAIFLQYTGTAWVLILEPILFRVPLRRLNLVTVVLSFLGMGLFLFEDFDPRGGWGMLIAVISGLLFAGLVLGQRHNGNRERIAAIFWGNLWVVLLGLPFWWQAPAATGTEHAMLAFLGIVQIGIGYLLFTYGIQRIPAVDAALITMLEPVLNPIWVFLGYGERPGYWAVVGGAIIILALTGRTLVNDRQRRQRQRRERAG